MSNTTQEARDEMVAASFYDADLGIVIVPAPRIDALISAVRSDVLADMREKVGDLCSFKDDPNHDGGEPLCNYCVEGNTLLRVFAILDSMKNAELDSDSPDRILPAPVQEEHGDPITPTPNGPPTEA